MTTKVLIYCTKGEADHHLLEVYSDETYTKTEYEYDYFVAADWQDYCLDGKIVAECEVDCEEIYGNYLFSTDTLSAIELEEKSCLSQLQLFNYLKGKTGYALHITNLRPFARPLELSEVYSIKDIGGGFLITRPLTKATQSMQRVSICSCEYGFAPSQEDIRILISCSPKECANILNGIQTSLVRKKILKGM